jgi:hypothetical protein
MQKRKRYGRVKFSARILRKALDACQEIATNKKAKLGAAKISLGPEQWSFDTIEEFMTRYADKTIKFAELDVYWDGVDTALSLFCGTAIRRLL